jgi:hypothetical protein
MNIRPVGAELFQADGLAGRHDRFSEFCERAQTLLTIFRVIFSRFGALFIRVLQAIALACLSLKLTPCVRTVWNMCGYSKTWKRSEQLFPSQWNLSRKKKLLPDEINVSTGRLPTHKHLAVFSSRKFPTSCKFRMFSPLKTIRKFKQLMPAFCLAIKDQTYNFGLLRNVPCTEGELKYSSTHSKPRCWMVVGD